MATADPGTDPGVASIGQIASGLAGDVQDLVRGELKLARAEIDAKVHGLTTAAISVVGGALVAFAGLVVVLEGGAALLAFWLPAWASLLIIGVVIMLIGGLVSRSALSRFSLKAVTPARTIANVDTDSRLIKDHL